MVSEQEVSSKRMSAFLESLPSPDLEGARERVFARIETTMRTVDERRSARPWWRSDVQIPLPVFAAAAVTIIVLAAVVFMNPLNKRDDILDIASGGEQLDIKVHVDAEHTADLLTWLNSQEVGSITIQLPETAEFSVHGEPVLMRSEQLMIEPLYEETDRE